MSRVRYGDMIQRLENQKTISTHIVLGWFKELEITNNESKGRIRYFKNQKETRIAKENRHLRSKIRRLKRRIKELEK